MSRSRPPVPFTFRQLEVFLAVAEAPTMTDAAARLHSSPSAVSSAVTELEKNLKVTLFERRPAKGTQLTSYGLELLDRATGLLDGAGDVAVALSDAPEEVSGDIRVGVYTAVASSVLPGLVAGFQQRFPRVSFTPRLGDQRQIQGLFAAGELDVALTYGRFLAPGLDFRRVLSRRPHAVLPADHRLADRDAISLQELEEEDFVLLDLHPSSENTLAWFEAAGVRPKVSWTVNDIALARSLVGEGLGYTLLLQRPAHDLTDSGHSIATVAIDPAPEAVDLFITWKTLPTGIPYRVRAFIEHTVQAGGADG